MIDMEPVGLFFGSFNPIHNGHLAIARYLLKEGYCRKVWFVVSPQNPWKEDRTLLDEEKRLEIVKASIEQEPGMEVCDVELSMQRPSYTYQTLQVLSQKFPARRFALIMGADNLLYFHLWRNYEEIQANYLILVYPRPNVDVKGVNIHNINMIDAPLSTISSTEIRGKIQAGNDISSLVSAHALSLILNNYKDL